MPALPQPFDASAHEPLGDRTPIPIGEYLMSITESDLKDTKDPSNADQYLELVAKVIEGVHAGRQIWIRMNLVNSNPQAVEIAQAELTSICRAVGVGICQQSEQLHDRPFLAKVGLEKAREGYEPRNEIKGYKPASTAAPAPAPAAAAAYAAASPAAPPVNATPAADAASAAPPWAR